MTEAYDYSFDAQPCSKEDKPDIQALPDLPPEIKWMTMLLMDGNSRIVDYRGCDERGGRPRRYVDPAFLARPALKAVKQI